jgi:hypothetical protein
MLQFACDVPSIRLSASAWLYRSEKRLAMTEPVAAIDLGTKTEYFI